MQAGKLRHRVIIQYMTETPDAYGEPIRSWATLTTVWASIAPVGGREAARADMVSADSTHTVTMRYYPGLSPTHRFLWGTRVFEIVNIRNTAEVNRELICECREAA